MHRRNKTFLRIKVLTRDAKETIMRHGHNVCITKPGIHQRGEEPNRFMMILEEIIYKLKFGFSKAVKS